MPTGSFYSGSPDSIDRDRDTSLTGKASPSQPSGQLTGTTTNSFAGGWRGPAAPNIAPPAGDPSTSTTQLGLNQFPLGQGPSATSPGSIAQYPPVLSAATSLSQTLYGPQQQLLANQLARQYDQLGLIGANVDYQSDALKRDNALAMQLLGLDKQSLGIERGVTSGQLSNLGRLREILSAQRGLAGEGYANDLKKLGIDETTVRDMASRKQFDLRSDLTQRGAFNTVANERGTGRINRDLMYELGQIGTQRTGANIQYKLANLGLDAQRLDISGEQLTNALADGLYNIGLGGMTNINSLLDAIGSTNAQQAALATEILKATISYSGLPQSEIDKIMALLNTQTASTTASRDSTLTGSRVPR